MISITQRASQELLELIKSQGAEEAAVRVWVAGGGCSGLSYGMALDTEKPEAEDSTFVEQGINVIIDKMSQQYMDGAVIDFVEDEMGGGFKIDNPNATNTCGCGSSFSSNCGDAPANGGGGCGSGGGCCG